MYRTRISAFSQTKLAAWTEHRVHIGIVAAVVQSAGELGTVARIFGNVGVLRQKPVQKPDTEGQ